ncbi:MAG: Carbohydrate binding domain [Thermomicrobiales bacterium]|nr:Carbohydrate binding domain [Thermomicrobiales bacterium]
MEPRSPSPTASLSPTIVVSTAEVLDNGNFEGGDRGWYVEDGARIAQVNAHAGHRALILPAGGAYADQYVAIVTGATYRLSAWALVGAAGDSGVVGIRFIDDDGKRLSDQEPPPLSFTATDYSRMTITFMVPEGVAGVTAFVWKPAGNGILAVDDVSLRVVPSGAA